MTARTLAVFTAALLCTATSSPAVTTFFGPSGPYLQASDSPFSGLAFSYFHLEDHEDGELNTPGVTANMGSVVNPGSFTDSVDGDDAVLDGSGTAGHSYFPGSGNLTLVYTFDEGVLGTLPTHAGVVYTNSFELDITLEGFDAAGVSVGQLGPELIAGTTTTATAVFVGVQHDEGLSRIEVTFAFTGGMSTIEVDHLQYGYVTPPPTTSSTTTTSTSTSTTSTTSTSTTTTSSTSTTMTTSTSTTSTTSTSITTTSTLPATFLSGKKLLVKQTKSGVQKLKLLAKDLGVSAAQPCEVDGELIIEAVGAGSAPVRLSLDAALWKPIKAKKPEKGCKYRKGPVVATVLIKSGKVLKVVASGPDLGVPLGTDPRPVRIELRQGDHRHCVEFDEPGNYVADKKLLGKNSRQALGCPSAGSPNGAFLD